MSRPRPASKAPARTDGLWRQLPSLLAAAAIIYSLGYMLVLDTSPRISVISDERRAGLLRSTEVYAQAGQDVMSDSILSRFKPTINTNQLARQLMERFPELAEVSVTVPLAGHRPIFELEPVSPALTLESGGETYILSQSGKAVILAAEAGGLSRVDLPKVDDLSGLSLKAGTAALTSSQVGFIREVAHQLKAKGVGINRITLPQVAEELRVYPKDSGYFVKFNMTGDARLQSGTFLAVKGRLEADGSRPREYIDVRVEEKAFYK